MSDKRRKIAFVGNSSQTMILFRMGVIRALVPDYDISVIAPRDSNIRVLREAGVRFIPIDIDCKGTNPFSDLRLCYQLYRIYRAEQFDAVFHYTIKPVVFGGWAARFAGIQYTEVVTGLGYSFLNKGLVQRVVRWLYRMVLNGPGEVWLMNRDDQVFFVEQKILSKARARVINGEGVNLSFFSPMESGEMTNEPFRFLFVGRVLWDKGIAEYIDAAREIKHRCPDVEFQILGPLGVSNPASVPQERVDDWVREGIVTYLGEVEDVRPYMRQASCIVLPSYREGLSRVLMEAAAMAKPMVATNVPGCRDVVSDGKNGFLCEPRQVSSLVACLMQMLSVGEEQRSQMGRFSRNLAMQQFDEQRIIAIYRDRLSELFSE